VLPPRVIFASPVHRHGTGFRNETMTAVLRLKL
jgi:hypothetical protein